MKAEIIKTEPDFKPIKLEITLETQKDVDAFYAVGNRAKEALARCLNEGDNPDLTASDCNKAFGVFYDLLSDKATI